MIYGFTNLRFLSPFYYESGKAESGFTIYDLFFFDRM